MQTLHKECLIVAMGQGQQSILMRLAQHANSCFAMTTNSRRWVALAIQSFVLILLRKRHRLLLERQVRSNWYYSCRNQVEYITLAYRSGRGQAQTIAKPRA